MLARSDASVRSVQMLERFGYRDIDICFDGQQAVDAAESRVYDLIVHTFSFFDRLDWIFELTLYLSTPNSSSTCRCPSATESLPSTDIFPSLACAGLKTDVCFPFSQRIQRSPLVGAPPPLVTALTAKYVFLMFYRPGTSIDLPSPFRLSSVPTKALEIWLSTKGCVRSCPHS